MAEEFSIYVVGPSDCGGADEREVSAEDVPQAVAHGLGETFFGEQAISADTLRKSWNRTQGVLFAMIEDAEQNQDKSFQLDEIDVSLAVSGKGYIGFASAKAAAVIKLKFKRR